MAFQQSTPIRHQLHRTITTNSHDSPSYRPPSQTPIEQSQEWVLFSPSVADSVTDQTHTSRTAGLSRLSDLGSLNTGVRSGHPSSSVLEEDVTEDGELDSLDDGLHAFREPPQYRTTSDQINVPVLPTHDGLGTFPASSSLVLEKLWQHEQYNPKRKHEGLHRRPSSLMRRLDTVEEMEAQANEEKRIRIEKWRMEQSQAVLEEVERETRRQLRRNDMRQTQSLGESDSMLGSTPRQTDSGPSDDASIEDEPFWRRITRKFIRDVIGIDEPLLSVILGESLPGDATPRQSSPVPTSIGAEIAMDQRHEQSWRDKVLQRIAKELGVLVHQISPHPGAFSSYLTSSTTADYAGIPIRTQSTQTHNSETLERNAREALASAMTPIFAPTVGERAHAENWGFEEDVPVNSSAATLDLRQEREYWERELDVKMVFRYLANKFSSAPHQQESHAPSQSQGDASASRAAIIRQHHPLVAKAQRSLVRQRRDSKGLKRPTSSCASESVKSGPRKGAVRSGSSKNYWDIGGSIGSGSLMASGGMMGAWGEA